MSPADREPGDSSPHRASRLDRLAAAVAAPEFALAVAWGFVLVGLVPMCLVCALHFHVSGAVHFAITLGLLGGAVALVSAVKLVGFAGALPLGG